LSSPPVSTSTAFAHGNSNSVEAETVEILAELRETVVELIAVALASHLELCRETLDAALRQRPAHQQVDAPAADGVLAIDRRHPGGPRLDLGAAVDDPVKPRHEDQLGGGLRVGLTPEHPLGVGLPESGEGVREVVPEQAAVRGDVGVVAHRQEGLGGCGKSSRNDLAVDRVGDLQHPGARRDEPSAAFARALQRRGQPR
jgi:hypothetical protein